MLDMQEEVLDRLEEMLDRLEEVLDNRIGELLARLEGVLAHARRGAWENVCPWVGVDWDFLHFLFFRRQERCLTFQKRGLPFPERCLAPGEVPGEVLGCRRGA